MTIACNPGGGTVDCVRWAQIDLTNATVVDAGVYGSSGEYRFFADLAVNHCNDMTVGYTKSSISMYPGIWVAGRESSDAAGTLQAETEMRAGDITYTAFDTVPRRWGDYTEMTIDPDGVTFWYLGQYSKNTGTTNGRWGTYIGSYSYPACTADAVDPPPTVTITVPATGSTVSGPTVEIRATASGDNEVTQVEFFVDDAGSIFVDTDGSDGWLTSWDSTSVGDGTHSIRATATDTALLTGDDSVDVTVDNEPDPPSATMHVGDLVGSSLLGSRGRWNATVTVGVHDSNELLVSGATVAGRWSNGANGSRECITRTEGMCSITRNNINRNSSSVTFTVTDVTHTSNNYDAGANHDLDGDSNGTVIVVLRP